MFKKSLYTAFSFFLLVSWVIFAPAALATEVEIYPGGSNATANATDDGWTDNHLVGQTFTVPANVNKINRIRLTDFKLGMAGQNNGGIVQVLLYAGAPSVSQVEVAPGVKTTQITPDPSKLISSVGPVYVAAWKLNHYLADLCTVDHNSPEDYALTELQINDPRRPCPAAWGKGGSTFILPDFDGTNRLRTVFPWGNAYSEGTGWQSNTTLDVPFPNNTVTPGGTYYIAIQQNYMQQSDYIDHGKYNCLGPLSLSTPGDGGGLCDKDQVFVASISTNNPYSGGQAYFNTYYYSPPGYPATSGYNPATGDLANFKIWGETMTLLNNATCSSMAAPDAVTAGQTFTASIWMNNTGTTTWTSGANYHLGSQNSQDNTIWGINRVSLSSEPVGPSVIGTFSFTGTAPNVTSPTQYQFDWKMVQDGVEWFGDTCKKTIKVIPVAPQLNSLQIIKGGDANQSAGTYGITNRRAAEGGQNLYNSITITQKLNQANTSNVTLVGTAFTPSSSSPSIDSNLQTLMNSVQNVKGFILLSAVKPVTTAGISFTQGYWIYINNDGWNWYPFSGTTPLNFPSGCSTNNPVTCLIRTRIDPDSTSIQPIFNITLYSPIGNHTWGTHGYLMDNTGKETSGPEYPSGQ